MSDKLGGTPAPRPRPGTYPTPAPVAAPRPGSPRPGADVPTPPRPTETAIPEQGPYTTITTFYEDIAKRDGKLNSLAEQGWVLITTVVIPSDLPRMSALVDTFRR